jgi:hypothetical protein
LGGYAFGRLGRLARIGDRVPFPQGQLEVVAMDGRRVAAVRVLMAGGQGSGEAQPADLAVTLDGAPEGQVTGKRARAGRSFTDREIPL